MKQLFRNILVIAAFVAIIIGAVLYFRPYIARWIFLLTHNPFTVISKMLASDPSPAVRGQAARTLPYLDRARSLRPLVEALRSDPGIREDVERALISVGKPAIPPLLDLAQDCAETTSPGADVDLLKSTVVILSEVGAEEGKYLWLQFVKDRAMPQEIRVAAVRLLGRTEVTSISQIVDYLDTTQMRIEAISAVKESNDVKLVSFLIQEFLNDPDPEVRRATISAIGYLLKEEEETSETPLESTETIIPTEDITSTNLFEPLSVPPTISPTPTE